MPTPPVTDPPVDPPADPPSDAARDTLKALIKESFTEWVDENKPDPSRTDRPKSPFSIQSILGYGK